MKKVLSTIGQIMFAACIIVCLLPSIARADTYTQGYLRYTMENESITITRYAGEEEIVTVPAMIAGVPVNTIATGAFTGTEARIINLPDCITSVEEGAFDVGQTVVFNANRTEANSDVDPSMQEVLSSGPVGITLSDGSLLAIDGDGSLVWVDTDAVEHVIDSTQAYVLETAEDGSAMLYDAAGDAVQVTEAGMVSFKKADGMPAVLDPASGELTYNAGTDSQYGVILTPEENEDDWDEVEAAQQASSDESKQEESPVSPLLIGGMVAVVAAGAIGLYVRRLHISGK